MPLNTLWKLTIVFSSNLSWGQIMLLKKKKDWLHGPNPVYFGMTSEKGKKKCHCQFTFL